MSWWDWQTAELILLEQEDACELQLDERIRERVSLSRTLWCWALANHSRFQHLGDLQARSFQPLQLERG